MGNPQASDQENQLANRKVSKMDHWDDASGCDRQHRSGGHSVQDPTPWQELLEYGWREQQHEGEAMAAMQGNRLEMEWPRLQNENEHQSPCEVLGGPCVDAKPGEEHAVHQDPRHCC